LTVAVSDPNMAESLFVPEARRREAGAIWYAGREISPRRADRIDQRGEEHQRQHDQVHLRGTFNAITSFVSSGKYSTGGGTFPAKPAEISVSHFAYGPKSCTIDTV
jgi:hypothetical protein